MLGMERVARADSLSARAAQPPTNGTDWRSRMQDFGEPPLTRAELEEHCLCALAAARHACGELAEDLNEATDAELVERVFLARGLIEPALAHLLKREPHRPKAALAFLGGVPAQWYRKEGRGFGAFGFWLNGFRRVTRADITPTSE